MNTLRGIINFGRDACWLHAQSIRHDVSVNQVRYRDEGSLAWAVDDLRLAWANMLEQLSGWAQ